MNQKFCAHCTETFKRDDRRDDILCDACLTAWWTIAEPVMRKKLEQHLRGIRQGPAGSSETRLR